MSGLLAPDPGHAIMPMLAVLVTRRHDVNLNTENKVTGETLLARDQPL
ncbi:hypothetical protein SXCC_00744 [Gluconacetobacter sp. SXCC-1]|nr:hypothetical protein SXCC_00744 [Gluconacetobacter sp. SXCC-1]